MVLANVGKLRLRDGFARMIAQFRAWGRGAVSVWARIQATEDKRFQESMGIEEEEPVDEVEPASCSIEPKAPSLADMIRKRQDADAPRDFMYSEEDDSEPDR